MLISQKSSWVISELLSHLSLFDFSNMVPEKFSYKSTISNHKVIMHRVVLVERSPPNKRRKRIELVCLSLFHGAYACANELKQIRNLTCHSLRKVNDSKRELIVFT